jgi:addiction module HigA family antidote
MKTI